jgi:hypothetical protein
MAEGSGDPCISHVDASHGEWPRIESSLLFCNFFYIVKIIEKSIFSEVDIGFTRKKTSKTRKRYFFEFFREISLWKKQGPFHPWSFWWGLNMVWIPYRQEKQFAPSDLKIGFCQEKMAHKSGFKLSASFVLYRRL